MNLLKGYLQRNKWLLAVWFVVDFIIIFLPQWLDSVWSLAERIKGSNIAFPSVTWAYWITVPIGLVMFIIAVWAVRSKQIIEIKPITQSENLVGTLTAMHRRLIELQKEKASNTRIKAKQFENVLPTLADRMGTVKFEDWTKFKRNVKSRIKKAAPRRPKRLWRTFDFKELVKWREKVYLSALSVAKEVKNELFLSKNWDFENAIEISEWLDGYDWGVRKIRDNDLQWNALYDSILHYLNNGVLRELIERHISLSYVYNNINLIVHYSGKHSRNEFSLMLRETLIGSPISPEEVARELSKILEKITECLGISPFDKVDYVAVRPFAGKRRADYERTEHLMWADIEITNISANQLEDVQASITKCLLLQRKQDSDSKNEFIMWNFLNIQPFCLYWSERQAQPKQMTINIPKETTRSVLVAYQNNPNGGEFNFNSVNREWVVGGVKIDVEISSHATVLWQGEFYIECHPNYAGKTIYDYKPSVFEFVEWRTWVKGKHVTTLNSDR